MARIAEPIIWLSLVDVSGPFLAGSVLEEAFPQGLEKIETPRRQKLRAAHEEWQDAIDDDDPHMGALHRAWVRMVLEDALEYDSESLSSKETLGGDILFRSAEHGIAHAPDFAVRSEKGDPRLLISVYPPGTNLENPLPEETWLASPAERMTFLCRANACRVGLVTNGEEWMLVNAPVGETSGSASWFARLWWQEPVTLKAFQSLLGVRRCFGPEEDTLPKLLERSLEYQEEITTTLGEQVRRAVEVLVQAVGRADQDRNGELLKDVKPAELYEAGLTVMMRLVFILSAEERGLLLLGDPLYDQHYSVSALRAKLREDADHYTSEVLERRHDAWSRLLATFRGIFGGIEHEALRLPALGGSLFDPDRFPFLEGRASGTRWHEQPATPLPIDNRTVLLLMTALQVLEQRGGALLLSYRALDVEQIGHVYEGLLEFTAACVPEVTLGLLGTKKVPNPQITLSELESLAKKGDKTLISHLKESTGRSEAALRNSLRVEQSPEQFVRLVQAANGDESFAVRLRPFGDLIRSDSWGNLLVYRQGSFAIVKGADRRSSGTHYTPRSLTEPIVRYTLEPLVYHGPAEGQAQQEWRLKPSAEILALKVCDMACGSGAFLVEACRYLSQKLVEAWAVEEVSGQQIGIDGEARESLVDIEPLPKNLDDRILIARRLIAQSCLYGVDINHLAVELAKLSIWLVTLAKNKPFSFLDHALRRGDSLIGLNSIEQLRHFNLKPETDDAVLFRGPLETAVDEAIELRVKLEEMSSNTVDDVHRQEELLAEAEEKIARLRCAADVLVAAEFWGESAEDKKKRIGQAAEKSVRYLTSCSTEEFKQYAATECRGQKTFHWPLEFPEVIAKQGGFDAFIGNPPYLGGKRIRTELGDSYGLAIKSLITPGETGAADLCVYFQRRAHFLARTPGNIGLLLTDKVAQGATRLIGLEAVIADGGLIIYADPDRVWPGKANVIVSIVVTRRGDWNGLAQLNNRAVRAVSSFLQEHVEFTTPTTLTTHPALASTGTSLNGEGFIIEDDIYSDWVSDRPSNSKVLMRYLIADDVNSDPEHKPSRFVINFGESDEEAAKQFCEPFQRVFDLVKPSRDKLTHQIHESCFWKHWDKRPALYKTLEQMRQTLVCGRVSKYVAFAMVPTGIIFSDRLVVVASDRWDVFAVAQSVVHVAWVEQLQTSMGTRVGYSVSKCFSTFPWPKVILPMRCSALEGAGKHFYQQRANLMSERKCGFTEYYNSIHDPCETSHAIEAMRSLHERLDRDVAASYGWGDMDLTHSFQDTKIGSRFTISEAARLELLQRLLKLNRERHEEENRLAPVTKPKRTGGRKKQNTDLGDTPLFGTTGT